MVKEREKKEHVTLPAVLRNSEKSWNSDRKKCKMTRGGGLRACRANVAVALSGLMCAIMCGSAVGDKMAAGAAAHERSQGDKALMEGKLAVALKHFEKAVQMNGDDHLNWYKRATAYIIEKRYDAALKDLGKVIEMKADYAQAYDKRAKIFTSQGMFNKARIDQQMLLQLKGDNPAIRKTIDDLHVADSMKQYAQQLISQSNWGSAREHLNKALEIASDCVELLLMRAQCHKELGDRENVLADTGKVLKVDSKHIGALAIRGNTYYEMDEFELAKRHYGQGLKLDPDHQQCKSSFQRIKKMENILKAAEKEVEQGQLEEALESYSKGAKIDAQQQLFAGKMNLGRCKVLLKLQRYRDAIQACDQVMVIPEEVHKKEDRIETLLARAEAYQLLEDWEENVRDCERALHLDKQNQKAKEKLERAQQLLKKSRMKDYYAVLEVPKDSDDRAIKKAYRKKAALLHPDKVCAAGACKTKEEQDAATKKFHAIAEAHEVLTNDEMRAKYDRGEDPLAQDGGGGGHHQNPFQGGGQHFTFHFG